MSRRKQRSAFDQVSEFDRGRTVAYRDCGLSFREISSRVGRDPNNSNADITNGALTKEAAEWNEVVCTDESRICLQHHDGRIRVWRHRGDRMLNSCHRHTGIMIELPPWHARFPFLSSIENMWSMVAQRLTQITLPAATPDQFWQRVEAAWSAVSQVHIQSLFESMS
ncbi:transposable element Tcb1 transposase [Trichonephila clavipes]|nr:transposable element Tcb1 transposase [Trichonephila clavipes]